MLHSNDINIIISLSSYFNTYLVLFCSNETKFEIVREGSDLQRRECSPTSSPGQQKSSSSDERMNFAGDENSGDSSDISA